MITKMIIIGVSVFFFSALCFSSCGDSSGAGGIVGIILGIIAAFGWAFWIDSKTAKEKENNNSDNENRLSNKGFNINSKKVEFLDLTIYSSNGEYAFNYSGRRPKECIKKKGDWEYEVKVQTGFSQEIDLQNDFSLAAVSALTGIGVILNGTDDNCITRIELHMKSGLQEDSICVYDWALSFSNENIALLKSLVAFADKLTNGDF